MFVYRQHKLKKGGGEGKEVTYTHLHRGAGEKGKRKADNWSGCSGVRRRGRGERRTFSVLSREQGEKGKRLLCLS